MSKLQCSTLYIHIFLIDIPSTNDLLNIVRTFGVAFQSMHIYLFGHLSVHL